MSEVIKVPEVLFTIYHPPYSICDHFFGIPMRPKPIDDNTYVYNVYIQNNIIHTYMSCKITVFLKNLTEYKIYSDDYSKDRPLLHVSIYDDIIQITLTTWYNTVYTKKGEMDHILRILQDAYNEYISSNANEKLNPHQLLPILPHHLLH